MLSESADFELMMCFAFTGHYKATLHTSDVHLHWKTLDPRLNSGVCNIYLLKHCTIRNYTS